MVRQLVPIALVSLLCASPARAEPQGGLYGHEFSFTLSLPHLVVPAAELTIEYATTPKVGIAMIGGIGTAGGDELGWDVGVASNGYLLGDFSTGLLVGAEYVIESFGVDGSPETRVGKTPVGDPFTGAIGLYGGAKGALEFGLTAHIHLGAAWRFPEFSVGDGSIGPLINLGVGWSI